MYVVLAYPKQMYLAQLRQQYFILYIIFSTYKPDAASDCHRSLLNRVNIHNFISIKLSNPFSSVLIYRNLVLYFQRFTDSFICL